MKLKIGFGIAGIILILDVVSCKKAYGQPRVNPKCECGISGEGISNRIVGGTVALPNMFPWIVAIFNKRFLHCGGALINDRYILTAGHCVKWASKRDLDVGLGMHDIQNPREGHIVPIDRIYLHEDFESDYLHDTNDIALIKLKHPVKFNDNIRPVCLPTKGSDYTGHKAKVAGWGRVTTEGGASRFLREATLKVMPYKTCQNTSFGDHLTESMMCAYNDDTDACQGDSGGPLFFERNDAKYSQIGIVSWGIGCAKRGMPGIYVKLTDYLGWIKSHTKDAIYCIDK